MATPDHPTRRRHHTRSASIDMGVLAQAHGDTPTTPHDKPLDATTSLRDAPIRWSWLAKLFGHSPTAPDPSLDANLDAEAAGGVFTFPTLPEPVPERPELERRHSIGEASVASIASSVESSASSVASSVASLSGNGDELPGPPPAPPLPNDWRRADWRRPDWQQELRARLARGGRTRIRRRWSHDGADAYESDDSDGGAAAAAEAEAARMRAEAAQLQHEAAHPPRMTRREVGKAMAGVTVLGLGKVRFVVPLRGDEAVTLTVADLHTRIELLTAVPAAELQLVYCGEAIAPTRTLAELGMARGAVVVATTLSHALAPKSRWTKARHHLQRAAWRLRMRVPPQAPPTTLLPGGAIRVSLMHTPTTELNAFERSFFPDHTFVDPYATMPHLLRAFRIVNITSDDPEGEIVDDDEYTALWNGAGDPDAMVGVDERAFAEASYVPSDEPCLITAEDDVPTARMPCGHSFSCEGLHSTVRHALLNHATEVTCPAQCGARWEWKMLVGMGVFGHVMERAAAERRLAANVLARSSHHARCERCGTYVRRHTTEHGPVFCRVCTVRTQIVDRRRCHRRECFCPNCSHDWREAGSACRERKCLGVEDRIGVLEGSPWKFVGGIHTPAIRACPRCATLLEHIDGCRSFVCAQCNLNFCYHCLRPECIQGTATTECFVAPIQRELAREMHTLL